MEMLESQEGGTQVDRMDKHVLALLPGALLTADSVPGENRADHEPRSQVWEGPLED